MTEKKSATPRVARRPLTTTSAKPTDLENPTTRLAEGRFLAPMNVRQIIGLTEELRGDQLRSVINPPSAILPAATSTDLDALLPLDLSGRAIKAHLDECVVGQEMAKMYLSILFSMHSRRCRRTDTTRQPAVDHNPVAPNALLLGPTGVGKTHSIRSAADYLKLPCVIVDSTSLLPSGDREGRSFDDVLNELVQRAHDIAIANGLPPDAAPLLASRGIILFEEFDRLAAQEGAAHQQWHAITQRALAKFLEGNYQHALGFDSDGILFIATGVFKGIDNMDIRLKRPRYLSRVRIEPISADIISYGFLPEIVARLPLLIQFQPLAQSDLVSILANERIDPTRVFKEHFQDMGKSLELTDEALELVAGQALILNIGALGLQQVLFPILARFAYDFEASADTVCVLDEPQVRDLLGRQW
jgi:ATP-dependent Clp protease ATP-binding subunit ClpX